LEKFSGIKFNKNPSSGILVVSSGRTDRHDGVNSLFLQFCQSFYKFKKKQVESLIFMTVDLNVPVLIK